MKNEYAVPCLFGLEGIAGDELRRLGMENVRVENGRVLFSGEERDMVRANICLRTGERVLLVLAEFPAKSFEELFQGVYHTQLERFNDRQNTPEKQWKITEEDWRNREKWDQYEVAVNEMIQKTSTTFAPWHILESVDKKYARIKALRIVVEELERALK